MLLPCEMSKEAKKRHKLKLRGGSVCPLSHTDKALPGPTTLHLAKDSLPQSPEYLPLSVPISQSSCPTICQDELSRYLKARIERCFSRHAPTLSSPLCYSRTDLPTSRGATPEQSRELKRAENLEELLELGDQPGPLSPRRPDGQTPRPKSGSKPRPAKQLRLNRIPVHTVSRR